jgi:hypothetical protein
MARVGERSGAEIRRQPSNWRSIILGHSSGYQLRSTSIDADSVIEYAQFTIHGGQSYGRKSRYQPARNHVPHIQIQSLESPALRHIQHATSEPWRTYVTERLQRWVWVESYKLKEAERPLQFLVGIPDHSRITLPEEFTVPETWDYADDQIPLWYQEWEQIPESEGGWK